MASPIIPRGWLQSPRRGYLIADLFYPMKTVLDERYKDSVPDVKTFNVDFLLDQADMYRIVLVIDLIDSEQYYKSEDMKDVLQIKITVPGVNTLPTSKQITAFIKIVNKNLELDNEGKIAVHCTHGYNLTGFMIVNYLVTQRGMQLHEALAIFAKSRPPGIYKPKYLKYLLKLHQPNLPINFPTPPEWEIVLPAETKIKKPKRPEKRISICKQWDKSEDRREGKSKDKMEERSEDGTKDESRERQEDRSKDKREDKFRDRREDKSRDRSKDSSRDKREDKSCDKREDRSRDRREDRSYDGREDRSRDRREDRSYDGREDRSRDRREDRSRDRREDRSRDRREYTSRDRREDRSRDRREDRSRDRREDRSYDGREDRSRDRQEDRFRDRREDKFRDIREDRFRDRREYTSRDRREDRSRDRREDRFRDRLEDRPRDRPRDRREDRPRDRREDISCDRKDDITKYKLEDLPKDKIEDKIEDRIEDRIEDIQDYTYDPITIMFDETEECPIQLLTDKREELKNKECPKEECPKEECPKEECPKEERPKEECPKEERPKHKHSPVIGKKRSSALLDDSIETGSLKKRRIEDKRLEPECKLEIKAKLEIETPKFLVNMNLKDKKTVDKLKIKLQNILQTTMYGFVGHKYKLLTGKSYKKFMSREYYHTWRTNGKRYLMFISNENQIYLIDEQNRYFKVDNFSFPHPHREDEFLTGTILDGELVADNISSKIYYVFLISDIYALDGNRIYQESYSVRLGMIQEFIMDVRKEKITRKSKLEPFEIMIKTISENRDLGNTWIQLKKNVPHEMTGLIFYPYRDISYTFLGRATIYIWIPTYNRYVKFKLKAVIDNYTEKWIGLLFAYGSSEPFTKIKYILPKEKELYDGKIVRCFWSKGFWKINKHDPDDRIPTSKWDVDEEARDWEDPILFRDINSKNKRRY